MNQHKSYVEGFGPRNYRRFRIVDQNRGFWAGEDWNQDASSARLFCSWADAAREYALIQTYENLDKPSSEYRATVSVTVLGDRQMDIDELGDYLRDTTKLSLVKPSPNGEAVLVQLHWDQLELVSTSEPPREDHSAS